MVYSYFKEVQGAIKTIITQSLNKTHLINTYGYLQGLGAGRPVIKQKKFMKTNEKANLAMRGSLGIWILRSFANEELVFRVAMSTAICFIFFLPCSPFQPALSDHSCLE